ncbi:putative calcium-transporting ATPase 11, plasma membrane-type [Chenopodium quinoa]|uniref:Calcium-transporting ATPase n=1 Tax=Chenopodium quinoa TaxID=63459 RepID=A0A803MYH2_CHEQI|nr:putative calcium-transporting ATPase 11, plasma membrane-type [Chenopodium quinoa]
MEKYLRENFDVDPKRPSEETLRRWRSAVWLVKNPRRRFRMVADLAKRQEAARKRLKLQEKMRVALYVQKAALHFMDAGRKDEFTVSEEAKQAGYEIHADELASIVRGHKIQDLKAHGGVEGIAEKISASFKNGVSSNETEQRENIFGANRFIEKPARSFWSFVWDALQDLTLIILLVCAAVSVGVGLATEGWPKGMYDGTGIILSIVLVVMVTAISDYKQSLQFKDLDKEKKNIKVHATRDGKRKQISIHDLVVGDVVVLSVGDQVPADGLFISGYNLSIDESSLSGESDPVHVTKEKPFLLSGTKVQDGSAKMLVTAVGMRTEWGSLMETLNDGDEEETPLQVKLNGVATIIGKIGLGFAVVTFLVLVGRFTVEKSLQNEMSNWSSKDALKLLDYFATAVTIIVVAVPEGLPLAVTLSLAFAMKKLMNDRALVRHLSACETMGSASCICTDKTGTLTTNHMEVTKLWVQGQVMDIFYTSGDAVESLVGSRAFDILLQAIFLNSTSEIVRGVAGTMPKVLGTPTERAILDFGLILRSKFATFQEDYKILKMEPFNSVKKKMSVLAALPSGGVRAFTKGASEIILDMCDKLLDPNGKPLPLSKVMRQNITNVINNFASGALRTICIAYKDMEENSSEDSNIPEENYTLIAVVGIKDPLRPGVKEAVQTCLDAGITVRMVTGDNINTAKAIARECGILTSDGLAIEGPEFRNMTPKEMQDIIPKLQVMARSMPLDKHTLVTQLRQNREIVAVTGDGTNDAPALHEADIGIAMGIAGTEVAKENADVVIMDDNFATILKVACWGRSVYVNIQKFVQFQLTVNIVALVTNFASACITGSAPLTAVQLLWVNMIMDTLGALALATEPPNEQLLMKRPPVGRDEPFITNIMWRNIIGHSIYQLVALGVLQFGGEHLLGLTGPNATKTLNTFIFNTFVFCQVFNEINSRYMEKKNILKGIFRNWIFSAIISTTVMFQVIIVEFLGTFADTVPLNSKLWLLSVGIGAVSLLVAVLLKCIPVDNLGYPSKHHDGYEALPSGPEQA